jgi:arginine exporter protein ArgO
VHVFGNYNKSLFPFFQFSRYKSELQQRKEENTSVGTVLDTTDTARSVSFLDPHIVIDSGVLL